MRPLNVFGDLGKDLLYAVRKLKSAPTFSTTAVLTIARGIGASTAMFSVVNAVMLRPLPYRNPDRLVLSEDFVSIADFFDLRETSLGHPRCVAPNVGIYRILGNHRSQRSGSGIDERVQPLMINGKLALEKCSP